MVYTKVLSQNQPMVRIHEWMNETFIAEKLGGSGAAER